MTARPPVLSPNTIPLPLPSRCAFTAASEKNRVAFRKRYLNLIACLKSAQVGGYLYGHFVSLTLAN
jgi:hypothetical protein